MRNKLNKTWNICVSLVLLAFVVWGSSMPVAASNQATVDVLIVLDRTSQELIRHAPRRFSPEQIAQFSLNQLNQTLVASRIADKVRFRLAGYHLANDYRTRTQTNGQNIGKDLEYLLQDSQIRQAREKVKADLVIMVANYPIDSSGNSFIAGVAKPAALANLYMKDSGDGNSAYASVFHIGTIIAQDLTFSHEVLHLLGAGHSDQQAQQCGPQSELDAAGAYGRGRNWCTLMSYDGFIDTEAAELGIQTTKQQAILSTPQVALRASDEPLGDDDYHNNAAVVVRHASAVAAYMPRGNEKCINDHFADAIPLPRMLPYTVKHKHFCRGIFYNRLLQEESLPQLWPNRREIFEEAYNQGLGEQLYSPEFALDANREACISCVYGTCYGATRQGGEPALPGGCGATVWYKVKMPENGVLEVGIRRAYASPGFSPAIACYKGRDLAHLTPLALQDVRDGRESYYLKNVAARVSKDEMIYIAVDSAHKDNSLFILSARFQKGNAEPPPAPTSGNGASGGDTSGGNSTPDDGASGGAGDGGSAEAPSAPDTTGGAGSNTGADAGTEAGAPPPWSAGDTVIVVLLGVLGISQALLWYALLSRNQASARGGKARAEYENPWVQNTYPHQGGNSQTQRAQQTGATLILDGRLSNGAAARYSISLSKVKEKYQFFVGRSESSDLVIADESVSRCHLVITLKRDGASMALMMADAGSSNGTTLSGRRVRKDEFVKVHQNDMLCLGKCEFKVYVRN